MEETGCMVSDPHYVSEYYPSPGILSERIKLFCGIIDSSTTGGIHGLANEGEDIETIVRLWEEAWEDVQTGKLLDAKLLLIMKWLSQKKESLLHGSQTHKEPV